MRSLRPLLLIPLAACAAPEHAEAPDFSWAWQAEVGQPITLNPAQSGDLLWSLVDAPEGSALWSLPAQEGSALTMTPDVSGEVLLNVERYEAGYRGWGEVSVQVVAPDPSSQRARTMSGMGEFAGKLPVFVLDKAPIAAAAANFSAGWTILDGSASRDPDGDKLTYAWTVVSVPSGIDPKSLIIQQADEVIAEVEIPRLGRYTFQLKVSANGRSATTKLSQFVIQIDDDHEPFPD